MKQKVMFGALATLILVCAVSFAVVCAQWITAQKKSESLTTGDYTVTHADLTDFGISAEGVLTFSSEYGYTYDLVLGDTTIKTGVTPSENVSALLDEKLLEGENTLSLTINSAVEGCLPPASGKSNNVTIARDAAPELTLTEEYVIEFTEQDGIEYELLVNGESKGAFTSGTSVAEWLNFSYNSYIFTIRSARTTVTDGIWNAPDAAIEVKPAAGTRFTSNSVYANVDETLEIQQAYSVGPEKAGLRLTADREGTTFRSAEAIEFDGTLVDFSTTNLGFETSGSDGPVFSGSDALKLFYVNFIDKNNPDSVLSLSFYLDGNSMNTNAVYAGWKFGDKSGGYVTGTDSSADEVSGTHVLTSNFGDNAGGPYGSNTPRNCTISVSDGTITFNSQFLEAGWVYTFPDAANMDLTGFGTDGVYVEFKIGDISDSAEGKVGFIVSRIGSYGVHLFANDDFYDGDIYTATDGQDTFRVGELDSFTDGHLVSYTVTNYNRNFASAVSLVYVNFVDKADNTKVFSLSFYIDNNAANANGVYVGWKYGDAGANYVTDTSGTGLGGNVLICNMSDELEGTYGGANQPHLCTIALQDGNITFTSAVFAGSWGNTLENTAALDLSGFGTEGVYIDIELAGCTVGNGVIVTSVGDTAK